MYCIVSYIARPAVTLPPGELIYKFIGFCGFSASRKSSCATTLAEVISSTSPLRQMMRSLSRREKISWVCHPPPVTSVTNGKGNADRGESGCVVLYNLGEKDCKVEIARTLLRVVLRM